MTLTELQDYVKNITGEDAADDAGNSGLFTAAQLTDLINKANKKWYERIYKLNKSVLTIRSADKTFVAATGYYDFTTDLNANGTRLITMVELKVGTTYYPLPQITTRARSQYEPSILGGSTVPVAWYLESQKLYLSPAPTSNQTLRISSIPALASMSSGSDTALGGNLSEYHELVGIDAARRLLLKDENWSAAGAWKDEARELEASLRSTLASRDPMRVRITDWS